MQAFKLVVNDPDTILGALMREIKEVGPDGKEVTKVVPAVTEEVKEALVMNIKRRMTPQPLKIRADIEMKCFQFDGVIHIKVSIISAFLVYFSLFVMWVFIMFYNHLVLQEAMRKAEAAGSDDCPVKIKLVAPPLYVLTTQTLDKVGAIST
jgi:translation initiation factor 2 subunit 1